MHLYDINDFLGTYNKLKTSGRSSLSPKVLYDYLYIHENMGTLHEFDPTSAVQYWMSKKTQTTSITKKKGAGMVRWCFSGGT